MQTRSVCEGGEVVAEVDSCPRRIFLFFRRVLCCGLGTVYLLFSFRRSAEVGVPLVSWRCVHVRCCSDVQEVLTGGIGFCSTMSKVLGQPGDLL